MIVVRRAAAKSCVLQTSHPLITEREPLKGADIKIYWTLVSSTVPRSSYRAFVPRHIWSWAILLYLAAWECEKLLSSHFNSWCQFECFHVLSFSSTLMSIWQFIVLTHFLSDTRSTFILFHHIWPFDFVSSHFLLWSISSFPLFVTSYRCDVRLFCLFF